MPYRRALPYTVSFYRRMPWSGVPLYFSMGSVHKSSVYVIIKYVGSGQYFIQKKWAGRSNKLKKYNEKDVMGNLMCSIRINNRDWRVPCNFQINGSIYICKFQFYHYVYDKIFVRVRIKKSNLNECGWFRTGCYMQRMHYLVMNALRRCANKIRPKEINLFTLSRAENC